LEKIENFLQWMNSQGNGVFNFSTSRMHEEVYHRYAFSEQPKSKSGLIIRVRDFLWGDRVGLTTLDFKLREGESSRVNFI
jgi:hypothetical protein